MSRPDTLVIVVRGGVVQEVVTDVSRLEVYLVDFDNLSAGDMGAELIDQGRLEDMQEDAKAVLRTEFPKWARWL